ncbi:MAG: ABC transporter ATP-binding protein/permease [Gammaproteobacteria bacterium]|nr:ABC transporter ATP-binding protein/permease [Gammaproteobacteria bacterium]
MPQPHGFTPHTWSGNWTVFREMSPYFLAFPGRIGLAALCLLLAKLANVAVPLVFGHLVDELDAATQPFAVPVALILYYGLLRFANNLAGEIRDTIFGRVSERAMHAIGLKVFQHLHALDVEYHLARRTGGVARDIERGTNGIDFLMRFLIFNIVPTLFEIGLVILVLLARFGAWYAAILFLAIAAYVLFSVVVTDKRTRFVRDMNVADSQTHAHAVDSLLNFETVRYFGNEGYEAKIYDEHLEKWETARRNNRLTLAALNVGQALIISLGLTGVLLLAGFGVAGDRITIGDFTTLNLYIVQVFMPLNFLGFVYREIKRALADIEHMFSLLRLDPTIAQRNDAPSLHVGAAAIRFEQVAFAYRPDRQILRDVSFTVEPGRKVAIVGPSGSGKSTIARLLFRFYDVGAGRITIDDQDIREVRLDSLRAAIGVVPQDTVLFNNTIRYNIAYGRPDASADEILEAVRLAQLDGFVAQLPEGLETLVGERGLKVSGGEKQRIAIARMLLKRPKILVFDEATSSLDSHAEQEILRALRAVAVRHTTLVIAHRLATIIDADRILVLRHGAIIEHGTHPELLEQGGVYARLWRMQQRQAEPTQSDLALV